MIELGELLFNAKNKITAGCIKMMNEIFDYFLFLLNTIPL